MRKADGSEYKRVSFIATRSALARHVTTFERGFDLITGPEFKQTNKMLGAVVKDKQRNGREPAVQHKQSITDEDWARSRFTSLICSKRAIPGCCLSTHGLWSQVTFAYAGVNGPYARKKENGDRRKCVIMRSCWMDFTFNLYVFHFSEWR